MDNKDFEKLKSNEKLNKQSSKLEKVEIDQETEDKRKKINIAGIVIAITIFAVTIYAFVNGYFVDQTKFSDFLGNFGGFAPIIFIIIQAFLTVFPVNPSGITNLSVVLAYGPIYGFFLNYIAIMIGSVINFYLGRKYGKKFIGLLFNEETINRQIAWLNKGNKIEKMFIVVLIVPFLPDDISCIICGMTDFKFSRFLTIIALVKPWAIAAILYIMLYGYEALYNLIF